MLYGINTLQNEIYEKINASSQFDFFFLSFTSFNFAWLDRSVKFPGSDFDFQ